MMNAHMPSLRAGSEYSEQSGLFLCVTQECLRRCRFGTLSLWLALLPLTAGSLAAQTSTQAAGAQQQTAPAAADLDAPLPDAGKLPPPPGGKPTVLGGEVRSLDKVRDQFTLKIFGGGASMKVLYDARTQLFRDGQRAPLDSLRNGERASVETTLDRTTIFALSIHTLTSAPQGQCSGQVISLQAAPALLTVRCDLTNQPIAVSLPSGLAVTRLAQDQQTGPATTSDLVAGTLVTVQFTPAVHGQPLATSLVINASPGAQFVFRGELSSFDLASGHMVVVDDRTGTRYQLTFPEALSSHFGDLHQGARVHVTATFDGTGYVASAIQAE